MRIVSVAASIEFVAGLVFIVSPSLVAKLLLNTDVDDGARVFARIGGFGLLSLGIACWPASTTIVGGKSATLRGLLAYNALAALLLLYLGIRGAVVGPLLWPAAALHAVLAVLLGRVALD
jgi:hypothetical protein